MPDDRLREILAHKRDELAAAKRRTPPAAMRALADDAAGPVRDFRAALREGPRPRVIAEIKRRSPSRGEIRPDFDPVDCAKAYADAGAAALSVLTDERFFGGSLAALEAARAAVPIPVLRKDFLLDAYQIDETRAHGADAVLLIVSALDADALGDLHAEAVARDLAVLVEVHDEAEVDVALAAGAELIGINNRDLHTFETDLGVTERLAPRCAAAGATVVGESGIFTYAEVRRLEAAGADAVLVGESLMREPDLGRALSTLRGES